MIIAGVAGQEEREGVDQVDGHLLLLQPGDNVVGDGPAGVVHTGRECLQGDRTPQRFDGLWYDAVVESSWLDAEDCVPGLVPRLPPLQVQLQGLHLAFNADLLLPSLNREGIERR